MRPLVSILIPAFNAEKWIAQTIRSALDQDYPHNEVILVNDGSSDRTGQIARTFASRLVKVIDQPNAGGPAARNTALANAQGDYIQWLDHDDLLAPNKISLQLDDGDAAQSSRILFSSPFGRFFYRPDRARFTPNALWRDLTPSEYFYLKFSCNAFLHTSCWLVSRELTELAGPWWDLRTPDDDGEYFCRVVAAATRIHFVPHAKSYWRVGHSRNFSAVRSNAALEAIFKSTCRCIEHYRAFEESETTRLACVQYLQDSLGYFYPHRLDLVDRLQALATELGGVLCLPSLNSKYRIVEQIFGYHAARTVASAARLLKAFVSRNWDRLLYWLS